MTNTFYKKTFSPLNHYYKFSKKLLLTKTSLHDIL